MSLLVGLLVLSIGAAHVTAVPSPENILLARKYAPQFRFAPDELYFPSSVEFFLPFVKALDGNGSPVSQPSPLTASNLDTVANKGTDTFLSVPDINAGKPTYLRGQKPGVVDPVVYTFIAPKDNGVVDIYYWGFYPFNQGKQVTVAGEVGDHVGDWERIAVRTVNGVATTVDYHAHSDTGSTLPWDNAAKADVNTPIAYIAKGSHGVWPTAANNVYVNAFIFKLADVTSDQGIHWNTANAIVPISYPDTYTDNLSWLNFNGKWGNKGTSSCWFYVFVKECEIVDGPDNPARTFMAAAAKRGLFPENYYESMSGRFSQTIATLADQGTDSEYTIRLDGSAIYTALAASMNILGLQQKCHSDDGKSSGNASFTSTLSFVPLSAATREFRINVAACPSGSVVHSYLAGLCSSENADSCTWSAPRILNTYTAGYTDASLGPSVITDDLDNFSWD